MAAAMSGLSRVCLRGRTKTVFSLPRLLGWRFSSDSATAKTVPKVDAGTTDNDNEISDVPSSKPPIEEERKKESTLSKFVRAVELWEDKQLDDDISQETLTTTTTPATTEQEATSFQNMLRKSKLFQLGNPAGRMVVGRIFEVHGDDLYIDFGGKFHCVCKTPQLKPHEYRRGKQVKVLLQDLEMSAAFLGSAKHVTLLEADATLIGLRRNPSSSSSSSSS